jgi:4'-phosphopantetheinyl transferase
LLRFDVAPRGKPRLAGRELAFNLSHSRGTALVAVTAAREVGVDVEAVRERDLLGLARTYFAPAEQAVLASLAGPERAAAFYRCWTRKEAYLKACGMGLGLRLDSFEVTLAPGDAPALRRSERAPGEVERWSFADPPAPPGFAAAVAVDGGPPTLVARRLVAENGAPTRSAGSSHARSRAR